jgi:heat shock protein HtpX
MVGFANNLKTVVLLGLLTALLLFVGQMVGGMNGLIIAGVIVIILNFGSFWFSDKIVLAMYRAKPLTENDTPNIIRIVRELTQEAKLPMPKVYMIPSESPNAFATGRSPKHAAVAVTQGIVKLLSTSELKGVIAHELAHVKNRDTLISTVVGTIAGVIGFVAAMARWSAIFGGFGGRDGDNNIVGLLVLAIVTPLIAVLIQLAISRSREYLADESGAVFVHNPNALADALEKLDANIKHNPLRMGSPSTAHLFIANPFRGSGVLNLLSTHPPMKERVRRLRSM